MKRRIVVVSVAVVILVIAAVLFEITIQSSSSYTNRVGCTDYEVTIIQGSTFTNGSQAFETVSTTTSFTTTTNYSATVGHTTANTVGPQAESGTGEVYVTSFCTFVK